MKAAEDITSPDPSTRPSPSLAARLRAAWSPAANLRALLAPAPSALRPVDGLRALSILWVMVFHTVKARGGLLVGRFGELPFRVMNRGFMGVDVFFVISGFLIARLLLRELSATGTLGLRRFYLRRALRILPAYYLVLALWCAGGAPCDTAWANLAYVNNFLPHDEQCMEWSWSLAIEEQFYLVFPLVLVLLQRLPRFRLRLLVGALGAAVAIRWAIVVAHGLHLPGAGRMEHLELLRDTLYVKPHTRYGGLLCGVIAALLVEERGVLERMRRHPVATNAALAVALGVVAWLGARLQPVFVYRWPPLANLAYYAGSGTLFAVAVAVVMLVALSGAGAGSLLGRALGWRGLYPIGQLSYSAYLIHVPVVQWGARHGLIAAPGSLPGLLGALVAATALALCASAVVYLLVERPFMNLRPLIERGAR